MTVKTVGEMVHGHTFDAIVTELGPQPGLCRVVVGGTSDYPQECGRPYEDHAQRPAMSRIALDRTPMPLNRYGFASHRDGCATLCEVLGICNCGMIEFNLSRVTWLVESQLAVGLQMADWPHTVSETMPSTEFRTAYAGLEAPTDVTVNGRVIGRWTPAVNIE